MRGLTAEKLKCLMHYETAQFNAPGEAKDKVLVNCSDADGTTKGLTTIWDDSFI